MKLELIKPIKALNKAYLKEKVSRNHIELFKKNLQQLLNRINEQESEEHLKNVIADFLKDTWYKDLFEINTKDRNDLVIHTGKTSKEQVGVILEVKKTTNRSEMMTESKPNSKALQELVLYYLRERSDHSNTDIKYLVITNIYEWYVIDEVWFEKHIFRNKKLKKDYENWKMSGKDTRFFYESIAKSHLDEVTEEMPVTYFDIRNYEIYVNNTDKEDDTKLIALYKILSPAHLLKQPFINDSNSLDTKFYSELLHIIGLEEVKDGSKKLIKRKAKPDEASLLENTIIKLEDKDVLRNINILSTFGATKEEQLFNVALELCIIWVNRVLFIKLLEAQLYKYHKGNKDYLFLNSKLVHDFDELSNLFFQVLAEKPGNRRHHLQDKFSKVPYLNSSLFERIELERLTINVTELDNRLQLPLSATTVLKNDKGKRKSGSLPTLQYLLEFLDAYDFSSDGGAEIQEENKNLINASVLGLIFEKINGYKDGSFFTPGYVTMYMCRETIRRSVLEKFNEVKGWDCTTVDSLYNKIEDKKEANDIINTLHICDPAVGSGHFLVSALNEFIAIKSELKILQDENGKSLRDYHFEVVNDELIITDDDGKLFEYNPHNKENQRVQETLFHEKEIIIENCLFGVDINPNSVKICRLRLWIELLKNSYYTAVSDYKELETLPNIDINIKCGNSLVSRFAFDVDLRNALKKSKLTVQSYKNAVQKYKRAESKDEKRELEELIETIKKDFRSEISINDQKVKRLSKLRGDLFNLNQAPELFGAKSKSNKDHLAKVQEIRTEIALLETKIEEIKNNKLFRNAFEWRFEFPEVLDMEGRFLGFDTIIGNPPYMTGSSFKEYHSYYTQKYATAEYQLDLYTFFIELSTTLITPQGNCCLITPNSWLKNLRMVKTRKFVLENLSIESINPNIAKGFDEAQVDTLIFLASKEIRKQPIRIWSFSNKLPIDRHSIDQALFAQNEGLVFDLEVDSSVRELIKKIRTQSNIVCDEFEVTRGVNPYDKYRGQTEEVISNRAYHATYQKDETFRPELRGKHVSTFHYKWDGKHFISYGSWLAAARDIKFFQGERIVFREILGERFVATIVKEDIILDRSLYIALPKTIDVNIAAVLGVLSSKLMIWLFRIEKNEFDDLFPKIRLEEFKRLPIAKSKSFNLELSNVVNAIIQAKQLGEDCGTLEATLDEIVYKLYDLGKDEIALVEAISKKP